MIVVCQGVVANAQLKVRCGMPAQCLFSAMTALDQMERTVRALLTPVRLDGSTGGLVVRMRYCITAPSYGTV
jgi:hypothetical protein